MVRRLRPLLANGSLPKMNGLVSLDTTIVATRRPFVTRRKGEETGSAEFASLTLRVRILGELDKSGAVKPLKRSGCFE